MYGIETLRPCSASRNLYSNWVIIAYASVPLQNTPFGSVGIRDQKIGNVKMLQHAESCPHCSQTYECPACDPDVIDYTSGFGIERCQVSQGQVR